MIRNLSLILIATAALSACNPKPENIVANEQPDPMADELANAAPVELPPAIAASKTYRCKDNSLVTIDWLQGGKGAYVHGEGQEQTHLKQAEGDREGGPMTAEGGYSLSGNPTAATVNLTRPGKAAQSCKA